MTVTLCPVQLEQDDRLTDLLFFLAETNVQLRRVLVSPHRPIGYILALAAESIQTAIDQIKCERLITEDNFGQIQKLLELLLYCLMKNQKEALDCVEQMISALMQPQEANVPVDGNAMVDEDGSAVSSAPASSSNSAPVQVKREPNESQAQQEPGQYACSSRIKFGAWQPATKPVSFQSILYQSGSIADPKYIQTVVDFSPVVAPTSLSSSGALQSPQNNQFSIEGYRFNAVDLVLDFLFMLFDDSIKLPEELTCQAHHILELTFRILRVLSTADMPNIVKSFQRFVQDELLINLLTSLDPFAHWKTILQVIIPLTKHECTFEVLTSNKCNPFLMLGQFLGKVKDVESELLFLQCSIQIVQLFICIVCNYKDGYDLIMGKNLFNLGNGSSGSRKQRDIIVSCAILLLNRELAKLENLQEQPIELSECDKLRVMLVQDLIKFLAICGPDIESITIHLNHIVRAIKASLLNRTDPDSDKILYRINFTFDTNIVAYLK